MSNGMHGPFMRSGVPVRQYLLDPYFAVLLTQVEGVGPVELLHVLVVYKTGEPEPVFFVTAELERGDTATEPRVPCLCVFAEDGTHSHLERSAEWADVERFAARAVEMVKERYGVTEVLPLHDTDPS